jgi:hypothetical protein
MFVFVRPHRPDSCRWYYYSRPNLRSAFILLICRNAINLWQNSSKSASSSRVTYCRAVCSRQQHQLVLLPPLLFDRIAFCSARRLRFISWQRQGQFGFTVDPQCCKASRALRFVAATFTINCPLQEACLSNRFTNNTPNGPEAARVDKCLRKR